MGPGGPGSPPRLGHPPSGRGSVGPRRCQSPLLGQSKDEVEECQFGTGPKGGSMPGEEDDAGESGSLESPSSFGGVVCIVDRDGRRQAKCLGVNGEEASSTS